MVELQVRIPTRGRATRPSQNQYTYSDDECEPRYHVFSDDDRDNGDFGESYDSDEGGDHVAAASENDVQQQTGRSHTQVIDNDEAANPDEVSTAVTDLSTETTAANDHVNMDRAQHVEEPDIRSTRRI
ncbi:hypothetical protein PF008_g10479 [Phytophthora fragariae]|uniref:Uncharacterized protein n=1 Tax=Phytophthora fragariae TaxID=53985 RepID=A0A6G0RU65_9STRA|nr:hypothetical protein PF008_g10479 [Phytophthora fragariae]